ncbi:hypothetical protein ACLB2K_053248 [Fragaria x ananassa]
MPPRFENFDVVLDVVPLKEILGPTIDLDDVVDLDVDEDDVNKDGDVVYGAGEELNGSVKDVNRAGEEVNGPGPSQGTFAETELRESQAENELCREEIETSAREAEEKKKQVEREKAVREEAEREREAAEKRASEAFKVRQQLVDELDERLKEKTKGKLNNMLWQLSDIPCVHAIYCIRFKKQEAVLYCHDYLMCTTYMQAYTPIINLIAGEDD